MENQYHSKKKKKIIQFQHQTQNKPLKPLALRSRTLIKPSEAYRSCKPCSGSTNQKRVDSDATSASERFHGSYRRAGGLTPPRPWAKETEEKTKSGESTPVSVSGRTESVVFTEDDEEPKEWVAQVEPGVLITFVTLSEGGNDLKRIRFSREMFNKWQAQRWWSDNYEKVVELYNVQRLNHQAVPLQTPARSEDESSKIGSAERSPATPPLSKERLPRNFHLPPRVAHSSSDLLDHHPNKHHRYYDTDGLASTPKLFSISGAKTERSSLDASVRSSSSREVDHSGEFSMSNASDCTTPYTTMPMWRYMVHSFVAIHGPPQTLLTQMSGPCIAT